MLGCQNAELKKAETVAETLGAVLSCSIGGERFGRSRVII
jgi:hypothetical protein